MSLKQVKCVNGKVVDASFGITHSAILIENGSLVTLGCNYYGQLGHGHTKPSDPGIVKTMADKVITVSTPNLSQLIVFAVIFKSLRKMLGEVLLQDQCYLHTYSQYMSEET